MSDPMSLVWGHSLHFVKFPMLTFSKGYCSHSFIINFIISMLVIGEYRLLISFLAMC